MGRCCSGLPTVRAVQLWRLQQALSRGTAGHASHLVENASSSNRITSDVLPTDESPIISILMIIAGLPPGRAAFAIGRKAWEMPAAKSDSFRVVEAGDARLAGYTSTLGHRHGRRGRRYQGDEPAPPYTSSQITEKAFCPKVFNYLYFQFNTLVFYQLTGPSDQQNPVNPRVYVQFVPTRRTIKILRERQHTKRPCHL